MAYVNGFLAPLKKDQLDNYRKVSELFGRLCIENGGIQAVECTAEGLEWGKQTSFPRAVDLKDGEIVLFSWMLYPSKDVADAANDKIMANAEIQSLMQAMEFDGARMIFSGFETLTMHGAGAQ